MHRILLVSLLWIVATWGGTASAEIAPLTPEQLQSESTHIVVGTLRWIGTEETREPEWLRITGVMEIGVSKVEKGEKIEAGDAIYARFWQVRWIGSGDPPPYGSGHWVPKKGQTVRIYLKQNQGGYDMLLPDGIEVVPQDTSSKP
jgi:hypothetical protein